MSAPNYKNLGTLAALVLIIVCAVADKIGTDKKARQTLGETLQLLPDYSFDKEHINKLFEVAHAKSMSEHHGRFYDPRRFDEDGYIRQAYKNMEDAARAEGDSKLADDLIRVQVAIGNAMDKPSPLKAYLSGRARDLGRSFSPLVPSSGSVSVQGDPTLISSAPASDPSGAKSELTIPTKVMPQDAAAIREGGKIDLYYNSETLSNGWLRGCVLVASSVQPKSVEIPDVASAKVTLPFDLTVEGERNASARIEDKRTADRFCITSAATPESGAEWGQVFAQDSDICDCRTVKNRTTRSKTVVQASVEPSETILLPRRNSDREPPRENSRSGSTRASTTQSSRAVWPPPEGNRWARTPIPHQNRWARNTNPTPKPVFRVQTGR